MSSMASDEIEWSIKIKTPAKLPKSEQSLAADWMDIDQQPYVSCEVKLQRNDIVAKRDEGKLLIAPVNLRE